MKTITEMATEIRDHAIELIAADQRGDSASKLDKHADAIEYALTLLRERLAVHIGD
jgi:hypothetical protein